MRLHSFPGIHLLGDPTDKRPNARPQLPCIRCGDCADACPAQLQPQLLLWQLRGQDIQAAEADGLFDCSECGRCDLVCPSHIALLDVFRIGKSEIRTRADKIATADAARERFESRQQRLLRDAAESAARQSERKAQAGNPDALAAALERAKAKRMAADKDVGR